MEPHSVEKDVWLFALATSELFVESVRFFPELQGDFLLLRKAVVLSFQRLLHTAPACLLQAPLSASTTTPAYQSLSLSVRRPLCLKSQAWEHLGPDYPCPGNVQIS